MTERGKISIPPDIDGMLRAFLHTRVAFPAELGFQIERPAKHRIDVHDVRWTYVDTFSAPVALRHVYKRGHTIHLQKV